mgnify:FL=1
MDFVPESIQHHPTVQAMIGIATSFFGLGLVQTMYQTFVFIYIFIWSLDRWGAYDIGMDDKLIFLEWTRWPIQQLERFVALKQ